MNTKTLTLGAAALAVVVGTSAVLTNVVLAKNAPASQPMKQEMPKEMPPAAKGELKSSQSTIVDLVLDKANGENDGEFDVLLAAVSKAGLVNALNGDGQLTVFAPTDQAFAEALGGGDENAAIAAIEALPVETLSNILLYHVTEGRRNSQSVLAAPQYEMLNGMMLSQTELTDKLNTQMLDISASNGIIHVINGVLMPASN